MNKSRDYRHLANMLREKYPEVIAMTDIPHEAYMAAQAIDELMDYIDSIKAQPAQPAVSIDISTDQIVSWAKEADMTIKAPSWGYCEYYHFNGYEQPVKRFVSLVLAAHGITAAPT